MTIGKLGAVNVLGDALTDYINKLSKLRHIERDINEQKNELKELEKDSRGSTVPSGQSSDTGTLIEEGTEPAAAAATSHSLSSQIPSDKLEDAQKTAKNALDKSIEALKTESLTNSLLTALGDSKVAFSKKEAEELVLGATKQLGYDNKSLNNLKSNPNGIVKSSGEDLLEKLNAERVRIEEAKTNQQATITNKYARVNDSNSRSRSSSSQEVTAKDIVRAKTNLFLESLKNSTAELADRAKAIGNNKLLEEVEKSARELSDYYNRLLPDEVGTNPERAAIFLKCIETDGKFDISALSTYNQRVAADVMKGYPKDALKKIQECAKELDKELAKTVKERPDIQVRMYMERADRVLGRAEDLREEMLPNYMGKLAELKENLKNLNNEYNKLNAEINNLRKDEEQKGKDLIKLAQARRELEQVMLDINKCEAEISKTQKDVGAVEKATKALEHLNNQRGQAYGKLENLDLSTHFKNGCEISSQAFRNDMEKYVNELQKFEKELSETIKGLEGLPERGESAKYALDQLKLQQTEIHSMINGLNKAKNAFKGEVKIIADDKIYEASKAAAGAMAYKGQFQKLDAAFKKSEKASNKESFIGKLLEKNRGELEFSHFMERYSTLGSKCTASELQTHIADSMRQMANEMQRVDGLMKQYENTKRTSKTVDERAPIQTETEYKAYSEHKNQLEKLNKTLKEQHDYLAKKDPNTVLNFDEKQTFLAKVYECVVNIVNNMVESISNIAHSTASNATERFNSLKADFTACAETLGRVAGGICSATVGKLGAYL